MPGHSARTPFVGRQRELRLLLERLAAAGRRDGGLVLLSGEPGSAGLADGHQGYVGLDDAYVHRAIDHLEKYVEGHVHTNAIENFWSLLKRCFNETWVAIDDTQLPGYLEEPAVRFNNRKLNASGRFVAALRGIADRRLTYRQLIARPEGEPPRRGG